ncbi:MAG: MarR family transcriptional regulator [Myxococcota bacterium]
MTDDYEAQLREAKNASLLQRLFRAARLLNEHALRSAPAWPGRRPRPAHMSLFPHIALEGTRPSELAEKLGVTRQAVAQLVGDLEAAGVVERRADPADGRAKLVAFTEAGRQGMLDGLAHLRHVEEELVAELGEATVAALRELAGPLEGAAERLAEASAAREDTG